ncbi:uncharacterized protein LOC130630081 [Hydractinia symbiolongicarpus]|uniref:uncharacterized protein LOC130630081 n=1 Tax=Hydractinia symbiolongicarpus TaxID=13093 RepID=UPI002549D451|nr:uncharacterized protein LOC130630081 [Hydractinia symbiolongicarpus]
MDSDETMDIERLLLNSQEPKENSIQENVLANKDNQKSEKDGPSGDKSDFTFKNFLVYRKSHPGSKTKRAFKCWKKNGGQDYEGYNWVPQKTFKKIKKNILKKQIKDTQKNVRILHFLGTVKSGKYITINW